MFALAILLIPVGTMGYYSYHVYAVHRRYKHKAMAIGRIKASRINGCVYKYGVVRYSFSDDITNKDLLKALNGVTGYALTEVIIHLIFGYTGDATYTRELIVTRSPCDLWRIKYRYPVGKEIEILYNKQNPYNSVISYEEWTEFRYILTTLLLVVGNVALIFALYFIVLEVSNVIFSVFMIATLIGVGLGMMSREYYKMNYKFKVTSGSRLIAIDNCALVTMHTNAAISEQ